MLTIRALRAGAFLAVIIPMLLTALPIRADLAATATISTHSTSAPYDYTITLHNTGTTDIGSLWFAWTDTPHDYDFLPSSPTVTMMPTGWTAPITHNAFPGDGYGIEFYNIFGANVAPGGSTTFEFTSPDSPAAVAGDAFFPGFKVTSSFVYQGFPQGDPGFQFNVTVTPEPSGAALGILGSAAALVAMALRRRTSRPAIGA